MQRKLCNWVVAVGAAAVVTGAAGGPSAPVMPLSEIEAGQKGLGWSVFSGHEPESFDVEVLGVWRQVSPGSSYVLARLSGRGLEETGVIAGMSGSPVYVDDLLVGAVAFSWAFATDAIAGVTPIESMRRMASTEALPVRSAAANAVELGDFFSADDPAQRLAAGLESLRPDGDRSAGLLWSSTGFGASAQALLSQAVGPMVASGAAPDLPADLEPGDAVAAVLIDGDLRLAATGTVTDRLGDTILAFGHAFLSLGDVAVPMATAEIITVIPSLANSFKVGNVGQTIGRFDRDRPAGVRGVLGPAPPMLPLTLRVTGVEERTFDIRLARIAPVLGALAGTSILGAIDATNGAGGEQEIDLTADIVLGGGRTLTIGQRFAGVGSATGAALQVMTVVAFLANNALESVEIESIDVVIEQRPARRAVKIVRALADRRVAKPGETLSLAVDLDPYEGPTRRQALDVTLPLDLDPGPYFLLVGDGTSLDAARLELEKFEPTRIGQAIDFLDGLHSRAELGVLGVVPAAGLAVEGEALARLPGSIREIWAGGSGTGPTALVTAIRQEQMESLDLPLEGLVRVDLEIEAGESR